MSTVIAQELRTEAPAAIEARGLTGGYGRSTVLHDVDLRVERGDFVVVLGANGAGKTTLLRALSGVITTRGSLSVAGRPLRRITPERLVREGVVHVPQGRGTFPELTVDDNLRVGSLARRDQSGTKTDLDRWYTTFPRLAERRGQKAGVLSGGEQQMLAIARACMSRPEVLLCDEPSLGLAPIIVAQLFDVLSELHADGLTLLVVEQNASLALQRADHAHVLESGRIIRSGPPDELQQDDTVRRAYLGY